MTNITERWALITDLRSSSWPGRSRSGPGELLVIQSLPRMDRAIHSRSSRPCHRDSARVCRTPVARRIERLINYHARRHRRRDHGCRQRRNRVRRSHRMCQGRPRDIDSRRAAFVVYRRRDECRIVDVVLVHPGKHVVDGVYHVRTPRGRVLALPWEIVVVGPRVFVGIDDLSALCSCSNIIHIHVSDGPLPPLQVKWTRL